MFHTIASFAKPQPDTILAIFLLKKFGEKQFPGANSAKLELMTRLPEGKTAKELEQNGYILIDLGGSVFDHHNHLVDGKPVKCASEIVAEHLGVHNDPALKKLLAYAKRDDLEGKGTISTDPLDRAFGLSGLLTNMNKIYSHDLVGVINIVLAMFEAHYREEEMRTKIMPEEWKQLLASGKAQQWTTNTTTYGPLRIVQLPTDNPSMGGFVRAYNRADMVIIRKSSGHVSIITNQQKAINLAPLVAQIRQAEFSKNHPNEPVPTELTAQGTLPQIPQWYYDTMANTIQNGGARPEGIPATQLTDDEIRQAITRGLQT